MSVTPAEPAVTPTEPPAAAATPPAPAEPTPEAPVAAAGSEDTPAVIKALRDDFKAERAKRQAAEQKAENATKEMAQNIGKALGLVEDETIDPAKLTESLTAAQAEARQARVELAVHRNAAIAGGNPAALLRDTSLLKSLETIDHDDTAAVQAAITSAIEAAPWLGATPTEPRPPAPNPAQGSSGNGPAAASQLTRAELTGMSPEAIEKARTGGRLNNILGIK